MGRKGGGRKCGNTKRKTHAHLQPPFCSWGGLRIDGKRSEMSKKYARTPQVCLLSHRCRAGEEGPFRVSKGCPEAGECKCLLLQIELDLWATSRRTELNKHDIKAYVDFRQQQTRDQRHEEWVGRWGAELGESVGKDERKGMRGEKEGGGSGSFRWIE
jgi:hypothetical protein